MARSIDTHHKIVQDLLTTYSQIPHLQETLHDETIFDRAAGRYMLVTVGWQGHKRVNTIVLHIDVVDGQVVVQCNNTDQDIVQELIVSGIPAAAITYPSAPDKRLEAVVSEPIPA